jgi:hypothetical protein
VTQGGFKKSIFAVTSFVDDLLFRFIIESFDFGKNILKKYIHIAAEFKFKVEKWSKLPCLTVLINISTLTNFNLKTEDPTHSYFKHFFLLLFYSIVHIHDYISRLQNIHISSISTDLNQSQLYRNLQSLLWNFYAIFGIV